ncbi:hypothetical protein ACFOKF_12960 [Sphingobium rhizovicinum]|uniref:Uncharacterized protein n=1 Tax=Sphingobium rhizovicinum TaxID=432308 RepID=A0ABV7NFK9_9SPHN
MISLFLLATAVAGMSEIDVGANSRAGMQLCSNPDAATKTCSAIASYAVAGDGSFVETTEVLIAADKPITLQMSVPVQVEGGSICGQMTEGGLEGAMVRVGGVPLPADRNSAALNSLMPQLKPLVGRKTCDGLRVEDGRLMKYGQVDRIDVNLPGKPVAWVSVGSGYRVAPR